MSDSYKATSSKNPDTNYTEEVIFERDNSGNVTKSIRVGGEPVELSEDQLATARKYLNVRAATDSDVEDSEETVEPTVTEVSPPNSPAAAEARNVRGSTKGGDK